MKPFLINPAEGARRSFSSFPGQIRREFGNSEAHGATKVIFIFLDAFGMRFFRRLENQSKLLKRFMRDGQLEECYAQFPSTTACHTTTIHFDLSVAKSGIFEWYYYEPEVQEIISPLQFSLAEDHGRDSLLSRGVSPKKIFPFPTFYRQLGEVGVSSFVFQSRNYTPSGFSEAAFDGAEVCPYETEALGISALADAVNATTGKGYFFLYLDSFDTAAHIHGPDTPESDRVLIDALNLLEEQLVERLHNRTGQTLLLLTADHGQVEIDPEKTIYLDKEFSEASDWFRRSRSGRVMVPGGSSRDLFLYLKPERVDQVHQLLSKRLEGVAEVKYVRDMIEQGYFGTEGVTERLTSRLSDLVVLPYRNESVWWSGGGRFEKSFRGHHGGLTPEEMEIPLLSIRL